jgi:hypothetical protein
MLELELILNGITVVLTLYCVLIVIILAKMNIDERMARGITRWQAIRDILNEIFSVKRIGR